MVMNLNTGEKIARGKATPTPLSVVVKSQVEAMARRQGITSIKFTNKAGVALPNQDWTAGVDCDETLLEEQEEENNDPTCVPPQ